MTLTETFLLVIMICAIICTLTFMFGIINIDN